MPTFGDELKESSLAFNGKRAANLNERHYRTVNQIVNGKRAITAITALRLARYFRMTPGFWMNLQARYDLETAKDAAEAEIRRTVKPRPMKLPDAAA